MNPTTKTTDLEFLKNFTKGDVEKMRRYINMYLNTTPQVIQEIEQFFEENNLENVRLKAHSIKPQVQYMGVAELSAVLLEIESKIINNEGINVMPALISSAKSINDKATIELKQFLGEL